MNTIMKNMTDPGFIIPYLIIAMFIGVAATYLRSGIDMLISYFTGKYIEKKEARRREQEKQVSWIASRSVLLNRAVVNIASGRIECIIFLATLIILLCLVVALPLTTRLGVILFFFGIGFITGGLARLYHDLRKERKIFWKAMAIHSKKVE